MSLMNKIIKFLKKTHLPQRPPDFCSLFLTQSYILEDNKLTYFMTASPILFYNMEQSGRVILEKFTFCILKRQESQTGL